MWINKHAYRDWIEQIRTLQEVVTNLQQHNEQLLAQLRVAQAENRALQESWREEVRNANELVAKTAAAQAYSDVWRVRVNELTLERAAFLAKILPDLNIPVPTVETPRVQSGTGVSFDDMGDDNNDLHRLDDLVPTGRGVPLGFGDPGDAFPTLDAQE